jgi:hypothetical protein
MFRKSSFAEAISSYAVIANYDVIAKRQKNLLRLEKHSSLKQSRNPVGQRPDGGFHHLVPVIAKRQKILYVS